MNTEILLSKLKEQSVKIYNIIEKDSHSTLARRIGTLQRDKERKKNTEKYSETIQKTKKTTTPDQIMQINSFLKKSEKNFKERSIELAKEYLRVYENRFNLRETNKLIDFLEKNKKKQNNTFEELSSRLEINEANSIPLLDEFNKLTSYENKNTLLKFSNEYETKKNIFFINTKGNLKAIFDLTEEETTVLADEISQLSIQNRIFEAIPSSDKNYIPQDAFMLDGIIKEYKNNILVKNFDTEINETYLYLEKYYKLIPKQINTTSKHDWKLEQLNDLKNKDTSKMTDTEKKRYRQDRRNAYKGISYNKKLHQSNEEKQLKLNRNISLNLDKLSKLEPLFKSIESLNYTVNTENFKNEYNKAVANSAYTPLTRSTTERKNKAASKSTTPSFTTGSLIEHLEKSIDLNSTTPNSDIAETGMSWESKDLLGDILNASGINLETAQESSASNDILGDIVQALDINPKTPINDINDTEKTKNIETATEISPTPTLDSITNLGNLKDMGTTIKTNVPLDSVTNTEKTKNIETSAEIPSTPSLDSITNRGNLKDIVTTMEIKTNAPQDSITNTDNPLDIDTTMEANAKSLSYDINDKDNQKKIDTNSDLNRINSNAANTPYAPIQAVSEIEIQNNESAELLVDKMEFNSHLNTDPFINPLEKELEEILENIPFSPTTTPIDMLTEAEQMWDTLHNPLTGVTEMPEANKEAPPHSEESTDLLDLLADTGKLTTTQANKTVSTHIPDNATNQQLNTGTITWSNNFELHPDYTQFDLTLNLATNHDFSNEEDYLDLIKDGQENLQDEQLSANEFKKILESVAPTEVVPEETLKDQIIDLNLEQTGYNMLSEITPEPLPSEIQNLLDDNTFQSEIQQSFPQNESSSNSLNTPEILAVNSEETTTISDYAEEEIDIFTSDLPDTLGESTITNNTIEMGFTSPENEDTQSKTLSLKTENKTPLDQSPRLAYDATPELTAFLEKTIGTKPHLKRQHSSDETALGIPLAKKSNTSNTTESQTDSTKETSTQSNANKMSNDFRTALRQETAAAAKRAIQKSVKTLNKKENQMNKLKF